MNHAEIWLLDCAPRQFEAITYLLAAFEPDSTRWKSWPNDYLNQLEGEFNHDRAALRDRIKSVADPVSFAGVRRVGAALDRVPSAVPKNVGRKDLRQIIGTFFSESELRGFCFDQDIEYDDLPGQTKGDKVRELIRYYERHRSFDELVEAVYHVRPKALWPL